MTGFPMTCFGAGLCEAHDFPVLVSLASRAQLELLFLGRWPDGDEIGQLARCGGDGAARIL